MKTNSLLDRILDRQLVSMIFPASCLGCDAELPQSAFKNVESLAEIAALKNTAEETPPDRAPPNSRQLRPSSLRFQRWRHAHWCQKCWANMSPPSSSCPRCGAKLFRPNPFPDCCTHCYGNKFRFTQAFAVGNYRGLLQQLVIRMKGQRDEPLAIQLGTHLGYELLERGWTNFDQIIPVPSHWLRKLKRGFQAASVIAESVSQLTGIPRASGIVHPSRITKKQGMLSKSARITNVRCAFEVHSRANITGQRILLVDDVLTSGATTSELARCLKRHGAGEVCVAVIARGAGVS